MNTAKNERKALLNRVLLRLAEPEAVGKVTAEGGLEIWVARNKFAKPVLQIDAEALAHMMREELLCESQAGPGARVISPLGRARLARMAAADTPHRSQHQTLEECEVSMANGARARVRVNHAESPLAWLARHTDRKGKALISQEEFAAGERLRRDFTLANLAPRVTALWGLPVNRAARGGGHDSSSMNDTMIAAKDRVWSAINAVGPDLGAILLQVCCHLNGLAQAERQLGWPARSAKVVLRIALERLAVHYGLRAGAAPAPAAARGRQQAEWM